MKTPIGTRWTPGEHIAIDTQRGTYEHRNPRVYTDDDERLIQSVVLANTPSAQSWAWAHAVIASIGIGTLGALAVGWLR